MNKGTAGCMGCLKLVIGIAVLAINPTLFFILLIGGVIVWVYNQRDKKGTTTLGPTKYAERSYSPTNTISYSGSYYGNPSDSVGRSPLQWYGFDKILNVRNYTIKDPLTYYSSSQPRPFDASCIIGDLSIRKPTLEPLGSLGYWPSYYKMSSNQRANYLTWLANGKKDSVDDIGYIFTYFYGLERRAIIDKQDPFICIKEAIRLLSIYTFSNSFNGYASRFIAFVAAKFGLDNLDEVTIRLILDHTVKSYDDSGLALVLAWLYKQGKPLPVEYAIDVARRDIRSPRSVIVDRVPEQFKALFAQKYHKLCNDGIQLKVSKRRKMLNYCAASATLKSSYSDYEVEIPNVLGIGSQFKPLVQIWSECVKELRPLSREVLKRKTTTREVYRALPDALKAVTDHPDKANWDRMVIGNVKSNGIALLKVSQLSKLMEYEPRPKLTIKQSEDLAATAHDVDYIIVPDPRITFRAYSWEDLVAVYRPLDKPYFPKNDAYHATSLMLELGVSVAASDNKIDKEEISHIVQVLESQFTLEPSDAKRLEVYLEILLTKPPSLSAISKRLSTVLNPEQKEIIGKFLIGVSACDREIHKKELAAINKAYEIMGLDTSHIEIILNEIYGIQPVEIQQGITKQGEKIPLREQEHIPIVLNELLLQKIMADTAEVSQILGEALCDGDVTVEQTRPSQKEQLPEQINVPFNVELLKRLDNRYHSALIECLKHGCLSKGQFDELARQFKLMPSNLLDTINTWSDEALGDFLIEEGETYRINIHLLEGKQ